MSSLVEIYEPLTLWSPQEEMRRRPYAQTFYPPGVYDLDDIPPAHVESFLIEGDEVDVDA